MTWRSGHTRRPAGSCKLLPTFTCPIARLQCPCLSHQFTFTTPCHIFSVGGDDTLASESSNASTLVKLEIFRRRSLSASSHLIQSLSYSCSSPTLRVPTTVCACFLSSHLPTVYSSTLFYGLMKSCPAFLPCTHRLSTLIHRFSVTQLQYMTYIYIDLNTTSKSSFARSKYSCIAHMALCVNFGTKTMFFSCP